MTTKNQCCNKCYSTYTTDHWPAQQTLDACINPNCKCHQSDSVVEAIDSFGDIWVKELEGDATASGCPKFIRINRQLKEALQQTAQQEKKDLIVEVLSKAEIQGMNGAWVYQGDIKAIAQAKGISVSDK